MTETMNQDLIDAQPATIDAQAVIDPEQPVAQAPSTAAPRERTVKARVLVDCEHGRSNAVVELSSAVAKAAEKAGMVDTDKAAVAYAISLASQQV